MLYWPSTELSIKRCTCVNKRKNSGRRCTLNNNITRCTDGSRQLKTRCRSESQRQTAADSGFGPSVTYGWATPAKMKRKKCCYGQKNLGQYSCLSPSLTHLSHTRNIALSRITCERYIFIRCVRSFIEVRILCLIMFLLIYVLRLYNTWFHITMCKLFVLDRNTWYHITECKKKLLRNNYTKNVKINVSLNAIL